MRWRAMLMMAVVAVWSGFVSAAELATRGAAFTIDGKEVFLLGCSYYGGLGASDEAARRDLDDLKEMGFNWIRVWATWAAFDGDVSAVDRQTGAPRQPHLDRLQWLIDECDKQGMIVNVTLSRGNGATGPSRLQDLAPHQRAVETLISSLKSRRNWYIDLANERNIRDKRFTSIEDLAKLRDVIKKLDETRLVTASHAGGELTKKDLDDYVKTARVDFVSLHRPRDAASPKQTAARTRQILGWMKEIGREVPLHYDEPFRRGYSGWEPKAEDFLVDLRGAREGGAAGWCFHNGDTRSAKDGRPRRSFDLREQRLIDQLDGEERGFLRRIREGER